MVVPISMRTRTAAELTEEEEEGRGGESLLGAGLVTKQASPLELGRPTPLQNARRRRRRLFRIVYA